MQLFHRAWHRPLVAATVLTDDFGDLLYITQFQYTEEEFEGLPDSCGFFCLVPARTIYAAFDFQDSL